MIVNKLKVKNFRNYDNLELIFEKGINYLFGKNGVGKTNLIEAIYYVSNLESFRTNDDRELIKDLKGNFLIECDVDQIIYDLNVSKESKELSIDGIAYKKYREYLGHVNVIEFCPEEVYLLKDFPKDRRKFLDKEISKIDKKYLNDVLLYNKLLKQRNDLLKSEDNYKDDLLFVLDDKLAEFQINIISKRKLFLNKVCDEINDLNTSFNKLYKIKIKYETSFENLSKEEITSKYLENREKDKEKKVTSLGIHKDDFKIYINDNDASIFGSQGEQRFIVLLIKLGLVRLVYKQINNCPILVLDDVFSELDEIRKKEIYETIKDFDQVFITGCNKEDIKGFDSYNCYEINEKGIFKEEKVWVIL